MIDALPDAPDPASDAPSVFNTKAAAMVLAQKNMIPQMNALAANLNSIAAGGAYAIPYVLDAQANVGSVSGGKLAVTNNGATLNVDTKSAAGTPVAALLATFGASSSAVKGQIRFVKQGDASQWLVYNVTSYTLNGGGLYGSLDISFVNGSNGSNFVFATGDPLMLYFTRNGDKGDVGPTATNYFALLSTDVIGAAAANIDRLTVFTSAYDRYLIEIQGVNPSAASNTLQMRLASAGAVDSNSSYITPVSSSPTSTGANSMALAAVGSGTIGATLTIEVRNVNDATVALKGVGARGTAWATGTSLNVVLAEGGYSNANTVSGFRLYWSGGANFTRGTVRVFGIKNS